MKRIITYSLAFLLLLCQIKSKAQVLNWAKLDNTKPHHIQSGFGIDYGTVFSFGYSHSQTLLGMPLMLNFLASKPSGKDQFDDFKFNIGFQWQLVNVRQFKTIVKIHGIYRQFENTVVRLNNFGSDFSATTGFFSRHFFIAGELGFDKAIVTHFNHTEKYKNSFPEVNNGWYEPSTGGNFYYGFQTGTSLGNLDISIRVGKILTQDFKSTPFIPLYALLGININL